jgi:hypothetical protein
MPEELVGVIIGAAIFYIGMAIGIWAEKERNGRADT